LFLAGLQNLSRLFWQGRGFGFLGRLKQILEKNTGGKSVILPGTRIFVKPGLDAPVTAAGALHYDYRLAKFLGYIISVL